MTAQIKVTAQDLDTGETGARLLDGDDFCLITSGRMYLANVGKYSNGTVQLTLKVDKGGEPE